MAETRRSRFAPSTTGRAHPGTLLAALLAWLDARSRGGEILLRLEDLDRERTKPGFVDAMQADLEWFGLDWEGVSRQSQQLDRYEAKLEELVDAGRVYACDCSRSQIRASGQRAPDGSHRYAGRCRDRRVAAGDWRRTALPLRLRLDAGHVIVEDESGLDLSGDPAALFGDPILRRRDGAYAYHFTSVLDDQATGIDRIVRGRDLAPSTTLQAGLRQLFGFAIPQYRHHALLLEAAGDKLSKLHGAVDIEALARRYDAVQLCGLLAEIVGLVPPNTRCRPAELVSAFDWSRVAREDVALEWTVKEGLRRLRPV
jgi:glutamyl-tRNA synthetase/glutamyl-Q tRNA(Asp) synthetase